MNMKLELGAEPRKVAILAGLLLVAAYLMYTNVFTASYGPPPSATTAATTPPTAAAPPRPAPTASLRQTQDASAAIAASAGPARNARGASSAVEFRPSLKPKKAEDLPDLAQIDPALRLDLLAKLQRVTLDGPGRSLFDFGAAPPPKLPEPKIIPGRPGRGGGKKGADSLTPPEMPVADLKPVEQPKPPPPPIPLKFYGYIAGGAGKRAFFLQGEDIFVAAEGETIKARFKVVKIGINAATVEDVQFKSQQSLPLELVPAA
ncbi:MAG: hypothetical protein IPJ98_17380 [Bryobacterales bacterium]|nr:hypothetical protein [Bryobacterales bacterium]